MDGLAVPLHGFRVLTGTANPALAGAIATHLGAELCKTSVTRFADGEVFVRLDENVRGADVFIVQPETPLMTAVGLLRRHRIGSLPVMKNKNLVGIITRSDILDFVLREDKNSGRNRSKPFASPRRGQ